MGEGQLKPMGARGPEWPTKSVQPEHDVNQRADFSAPVRNEFMRLVF